MNPVPRTCVELLRTLHADCDGVTELRTFAPGMTNKPSGRAFLNAHDINSLTCFVGSHLSEHNYFGVATRRDSSGGTLSNCVALSALFVDQDFKHVPEAAARRKLDECPFAPSARVHSGGGLHTYWLLSEPLNLQDPADCTLAYTLLKRLTHFLNADPSAAEPARVLRLPGTQNFKYTPPRHVVVELLDPERRYHASEFDELLPPEPLHQTNGSRFVSPERIHDGARQDTLYRLGRSLKAQGLSHAALAAALHAENHAKCEPPLPDTEVEETIEHTWTQPDRAAFTQSRRTATQENDAPSDETVAEQPEAPFAVGVGDFLAGTYPPAEAYVEGLLSSDGGGWIGGEEKLGKTIYALDEALSLALGLPVCGRFPVPTPRRVLFIEEEDGPRRTHARLSALLRGRGLDPDDPALREDLNQWIRLVVWSGFTFDADPMRQRLESEIAAFTPAVVYVDVLRKVTTRDLNKATEASALFDALDDLRRRYGVLFRLLHHYRKSQGFRTGRGSQEIGGSYVLGAWAENSLFFEPIGRKQGEVKVAVQNKDGAPVPAFRFTIESEGPIYAATMLRLHAEDLTDESAAEQVKEAVFEAVATLPTTDPVTGAPGVLLKDICAAAKKSDRPVKTALNALADEDRVKKVGKATRGRALYAVCSRPS